MARPTRNQYIVHLREHYTSESVAVATGEALGALPKEAQRDVLAKAKPQYNLDGPEGTSTYLIDNMLALSNTHGLDDDARKVLYARVAAKQPSDAVKLLVHLLQHPDRQVWVKEAHLSLKFPLGETLQELTPVAESPALCAHLADCAVGKKVLFWIEKLRQGQPADPLPRAIDWRRHASQALVLCLLGHMPRLTKLRMELESPSLYPESELQRQFTEAVLARQREPNPGRESCK